jgi:predicted metal-dependent hydrolase
MNEKKIYPWRRKSRSQIKQILYKVLVSYPFGATVSQISKDLKLTRKVIREELKKLESERRINKYIIGEYKIYIRKRYTKIPKLICKVGGH